MFRKSLLLLVFLLAYLVTNWLTGGEGLGLPWLRFLKVGSKQNCWSIGAPNGVGSMFTLGYQLE